jgi:YolD-like protein.
MKNTDELHKYDDIIGMPHHQSSKHPHMPLADRAAQFSPFAALSGHGDAIRETARLTDKKMELSEDQREHLNDRFAFVIENIREQPEISVTYFMSDERKAGGAYIALTGAVKKIDEYEHAIVMLDGAVIPIEDVISIDGDFFDRLEDGA